MMLECLADFISTRMYGGEQDLREIKGALEVIRQIVSLPSKIRQNDLTTFMVANDLKAFEAKWVKFGVQPSLENEKD